MLVRFELKRTLKFEVLLSLQKSCKIFGQSAILLYYKSKHL